MTVPEANFVGPKADAQTGGFGPLLNNPLNKFQAFWGSKMFGATDKTASAISNAFDPPQNTISLPSRFGNSTVLSGGGQDNHNKVNATSWLLYNSTLNEPVHFNGTRDIKNFGDNVGFTGPYEAIPVRTKEPPAPFKAHEIEFHNGLLYDATTHLPIDTSEMKSSDHPDGKGTVNFVMIGNTMKYDHTGQGIKHDQLAGAKDVTGAGQFGTDPEKPGRLYIYNAQSGRYRPFDKIVAQPLDLMAKRGVNLDNVIVSFGPNYEPTTASDFLSVVSQTYNHKYPKIKKPEKP